MASRNRRTAVAVEAAPQSTNYGPDNFGNVILAAWQGLYHLFGARVERFDITSEGITAVNLTVDEKWGPSDSIIQSLVKTDKFPFRRLDLFPLYFWMQGEVPEPFSSSAELTVWLTTNVRAGEKNRRPKWAKDAIQDFKNRSGIAVPRGRPRKNLVIRNLKEIDEGSLEGVDLQELETLREVIDRVASRQEANV